MATNAIKVYARLKPDKINNKRVNYQIYRRPKDRQNEDFLVLSSSTRSDEYIDNRPENWNFSFYHILDDSAKQEEVFQLTARPVVESVLDGYNGTVFAYGQTGSGKTFTINGDYSDVENHGIIPRSLRYIFDTARQHPENVYSIEVAYLEIYNEYGYDLLDRKLQNSTGPLRLEDLPRISIQEDDKGRLHLKNLSLYNVECEEEALDLFLLGNSRRIIADTPMNPQSSRSHCIFTITISMKKCESDRRTRAKMHIVDLAGSERVYRCSISGTVLTEAKHINLSLHYLEQVIVCLSQDSVGHVPYRNCLLTAILRDSLGGNCLTVMVATISVATTNLQETISTCRFAQRVAMVKNDVNLMLDDDLESENALLRLENERLRKQIEALTKGTGQAAEELDENDRRLLNSQIEKFLVSDETVCWNFEPAKVLYCFELLKKNFLQGKNRGDGTKELDYYKNLVTQRDKEISVLINMLKKEKARSNESQKDCAPLLASLQKYRSNDDNSKECVESPKSYESQETRGEAASETLLSCREEKRNSRKPESPKTSTKRATLETRSSSSVVTSARKIPVLNLLEALKDDLQSPKMTERKKDFDEKCCVEKEIGESSDRTFAKSAKESAKTVVPRFPLKSSREQGESPRESVSLNPSEILGSVRKILQTCTPKIWTTTPRSSRVEKREESEKSFSSRSSTDSKDRYSSVEDSEFEKSLPLTGDPEIDEEIVAFYKAKRSGGLYV